MSAESTLRRRLHYFRSSRWRGRREVVDILERISNHSEIFLFGGMLRDLLMHGNAGFDSDVDVVLVNGDRAGVKRALSMFPYRRNRFGGYRVSGRHWKCDLWHLEDTWAFREHLVSPVSPSQLVHTTFFTWDAAVVGLGKNEMWLHGDFEAHATSRVLDLNLAVNPDPAGAALRTLRYALLYQARMTRRMAEYAFDALSKTRPADLVSRERTSFGDTVLTEPTIRDFYSHVAAFLERSSDPHVSPPLYQYSLDLDLPQTLPQ